MSMYVPELNCDNLTSIGSLECNQCPGHWWNESMASASPETACEGWLPRFEIHVLQLKTDNS